MITKSGLRLGIGLPQGFPGGAVDLDLVRRFALRAEELGYDDLWVIEQITGRFAVLEPVTLLTYLAALTSRIRLGTAVLVTPLRNPLQLAKSLSTLDVLSNGRLTVGVGLGTSTAAYAAYGVPPEHRAARFAESVRVLKALWTQPRAQLEGRFWRLEGVPMEPKPLQKPHPPIWFGARVDQAMRRATRLGDGWMGAGSTPVPDFFEQIGRMKTVVAEEGRDPSTFTLSKRLYFALDKDEKRALERLRTWIGAYYGNDGAVAERWAVWGPADKCLETLSRMREAGLTHMFLHPVADYEGQLEAIAADIAPRL